MIEILASVVVVWRLRGEEHPHRTRRALRLVGVAFVLLAVALGAAAARDLWTGREAAESWPGIIYLAITAVVMFALAIAKRRVAVDLSDEPFAAEAEMTFLDGWLSTATLAGQLLNAVWGWWWADPLAGLVIAVIALREAGRASKRRASSLKVRPEPPDGTTSDRMTGGGLPRPTFASTPAPSTWKAKGTTSARQGSDD